MLIFHSGFLTCEIACTVSNQQNTLANLLALLLTLSEIAVNLLAKPLSVESACTEVNLPALLPILSEKYCKTNGAVSYTHLTLPTILLV